MTSPLLCCPSPPVHQMASDVPSFPHLLTCSASCQHLMVFCLFDLLPVFWILSCFLSDLLGLPHLVLPASPVVQLNVCLTLCWWFRSCPALLVLASVSPGRSRCSTRWCPVSDSGPWRPSSPDLCAALHTQHHNMLLTYSNPSSTIFTFLCV